MNQLNSFEFRIGQTESLIEILNQEFSLEPKSNLEEWPRTYQILYRGKTYKSVFSIFGSFTVIPSDSRFSSNASPIYYLSLNSNSSDELVWTKPDGQTIENRKQILEEFKKSVETYEERISEINTKEIIT
ncbi:hypothetical protein AB3N59_01190 [Leptospira sp. WS92.C1]